MIFFLLLAVMGGLALLWPAGLSEPANTLVTPEGIKPEWYFDGLFQLIKVIPELAGLIVVAVVFLLHDRPAVRGPRQGAQSAAQAGDHDDRPHPDHRPHRPDHLGGGVVMTRRGRNMKPVLLGIAGAVLVVGLAVAAGCASLATPEAPSTSSPSASAGTVQVSQQVKDGAQLYVDLACVRCHAPDGVGRRAQPAERRRRQHHPAAQQRLP